MATFALAPPRLGATTQRRLTELGVALGIAAIAGASSWFLNAWGPKKGIAMGLFLAAMAWLLTTRRTNLALAALMVYLGALDGFLKLATGSTAVTLVRDALLFAIVLGALVRAEAMGQRLRMPPLRCSSSHARTSGAAGRRVFPTCCASRRASRWPASILARGL